MYAGGVLGPIGSESESGGRLPYRAYGTCYRWKERMVRDGRSQVVTKD
jgi:hypothetical protein